MSDEEKKPTPALSSLTRDQIKRVEANGNFRAYIVTHKGDVLDVTREDLKKVFKRIGKFLILPSYCREVDLTVQVTDIRSVQFRYENVAYVTLYGGRKAWVPLKLLSHKDFKEDAIDQSWRDRTVHDSDTPLENIITVKRVGTHTVRVQVVDGTTRLISVAHYQKYLRHAYEMGRKKLIEAGVPESMIPDSYEEIEKAQQNGKEGTMKAMLAAVGTLKTEEREARPQDKTSRPRHEFREKKPEVDKPMRQPTPEQIAAAQELQDLLMSPQKMKENEE